MRFAEEEYERLIKPLESAMMRTVWNLTRNKHDAEEAMQEALCVIWRKWERVRIHPNPQALVLRICVNSAYDILRARARRERRETLTEVTREAGVAPDVETGLPAAECQQAIQDAISQLSRNQAVAITMRLVQGVPYHEIGRALGCQESTVRKHVERGRQRLRELLRPVLARLRDEEASTC